MKFQGGKYALICLLLAIIGISLIMLGGRSKQEASASLTDSEEEKIRILLEEMKGVDAVSVMLNTDEQGNIEGVAVICHGGDDPAVQSRIIAVLRALLGLGSHQIGVSG